MKAMALNGIAFFVLKEELGHLTEFNNTLAQFLVGLH